MGELEEEFANALAEGRQPNCIECGEPLEVRQIFHNCVRWVWDRKKKRYTKVEGCDACDAEKAECVACEAKSWDLVGQNEVSRKLGLDY